MHPVEKRTLRPNVAAIVQDELGYILIGERMDTKNAWQFPQGGVDPGEDVAHAVLRELEEEVGLSPSDVEVITQRGPYRYWFPPGKAKKGHHGQEQTYFLMQLKAVREKINIKQKKQEFRTARWVLPSEFQLTWLPPMKQEVYRRVFHDFFQVDLIAVSTPVVHGEDEDEGLVVRSRQMSEPFETADGSQIRSLLDRSNAPVQNQSLAEAILRAKQNTARHYHVLSEEFYYILSGRGEMEVNGHTRQVRKGDAILIPPQAWHQLRAHTKMVFLCTCAPAYAHEDTHFE
ncbi:MAG: NUDIX domain-containing protein [Verrucomicrobiales bacterium]